MSNENYNVVNKFKILEEIWCVVKNYDHKPTNNSPILIKIIITCDTPVHQTLRRLSRAEASENILEIVIPLKPGVIVSLSAKVVWLLSKIIKSEVAFEIKEKQQKAMEALKRVLIDESVLIFNPNV